MGGTFLFPIHQVTRTPFAFPYSLLKMVFTAGELDFFCCAMPVWSQNKSQSRTEAARGENTVEPFIPD